MAIRCQRHGGRHAAGNPGVDGLPCGGACVAPVLQWQRSCSALEADARGSLERRGAGRQRMQQPGADAHAPGPGGSHDVQQRAAKARRCGRGGRCCQCGGCCGCPLLLRGGGGGRSEGAGAGGAQRILPGAVETEHGCRGKIGSGQRRGCRLGRCGKGGGGRGWVARTGQRLGQERQVAHTLACISTRAHTQGTPKGTHKTHTRHTHKERRSAYLEAVRRLLASVPALERVAESGHRVLKRSSGASLAITAIIRGSGSGSGSGSRASEAHEKKRETKRHSRDDGGPHP